MKFLFLFYFLPVFVVPKDRTTSTGSNQVGLAHDVVVVRALVNSVVDRCRSDVVVDRDNPLIVGLAQSSDLLDSSSWEGVLEVVLDCVDLDPLVGEPEWNPGPLQDSFRPKPKSCHPSLLLWISCRPIDVTDCVVVNCRNGLVSEVEHHQSTTNCQDHFRRRKLFFVLVVVVVSFLFVAKVGIQEPHESLTDLFFDH